MRPSFCATKTRPSGEKRTTVGFASPLKTTLSWKPVGNVDAGAAGASAAARADSRTTAVTVTARRYLGMPSPPLTPRTLSG